MKHRKQPGVHDIVLGLSIKRGAIAAGIGENLFREEIAAGRIKVAKIGRRSVVRIAEIERWLQEREAA
jgi:hypothetical protein